MVNGIFTKRVSVRKFLDTPVEEQQVNELVAAASLAPSHLNLQPLRIKPVSDPEGLKVVRDAAYGVMGGVTTAPLIFICCADNRVDEMVGQRLGHMMETGALPTFDPKDLRSGTGKPFELRVGPDWNRVSASIGIEHMVLQAGELGLGTCWAHHFAHDEVRKYFKIPKNFDFVCLLTVGYPDAEPVRVAHDAEILF